MMIEEIKVGDVVALNSKSLKMTVTAVSIVDKQIHVCWMTYNTNEMRHDILPIAAVRRAS